MDKLLSALLYLSTFSLSLFSFYLSEICLDGEYSIKKVIGQKLFLLVALCLPCILACLRADTVGIDTISVKNYLGIAQSYKFYNQMRISVFFDEMEFFYVILLFVFSRIKSYSVPFFLFTLQLLTILPIYYSAKRFKSKGTVPIAIAIYLFCFYNNSLNIMRQSVACSFIILGVTFLCIPIILKTQLQFKEVLFGFLSFLTAILFHKSSIIGIVLLLFLLVASKKELRKISQVLLFLFVIFFPLILNEVVEWLRLNGYLNSAFLYYSDIFIYKTVDKDYFTDPFSIYALTDIFLRFGLILVPFLFYYPNKDFLYIFMSNTVKSGFLIFTLIMFTMQTTYGQRLSMFLDFFLILLIPYSIDFPYRKIKILFVYCVIFCYWIIWIVIFGWSGSEIYMFR